MNDIQEFTHQVSLSKLINSASDDHDTTIAVIMRCLRGHLSPDI
jgi:hypothetical protein